MRVYVDLDSRAFVVSPTLLQRVTTLYFTRRDNMPVEVQFVRNGTVQELAAGATGVMGIKKTFAGNFLASAASWTKTGTGSSTIYTFSLNLNTSNLTAEFVDDDEESVLALVEAQWTESGLISSTLPCSATIYNDVIRGGEGVPTVTGAPYALLQAPGGTVWRVSVDNDGILTTQPN